MSNQSNDSLQRAYELIESEDYQAAKDILSDYLEENPDDTEAWWLYSHAVDDVEEAKKALQHVVTNTDEFSEASELLQELEDSQAMVPAEDKEPDFLDNLDEEIRSATTTDDEFEDDEFDFEDEVEETESPSRNRQLLAGLLFIILIIFIGFLVFSSGIFNNTAVDPTPEPTQIADTGSAQNAEMPSEDVVNSFYTSLEGFDVIEDSASVDTTSEGATFNISICSSNTNDDIRANVTSTLQNMSQEIESLSDDIDAIGIRLINCDTDNSLIRFIAVDRDVSLQYLNGDISDVEFSSNWEAQILN